MPIEVTPLIFTNQIVLGENRLAGSLHSLTPENLAKFIEESRASIIAKANYPVVDEGNRNFGKYAALQDKFVGGIKGSYKKMIEGLLNLMRVGLNKDNRLSVQTVATPLNRDYIPELWRWCRENDIIPYIELTKAF